MSNENQILGRVQSFMNYHYPEIPRMLPEAAQVEYNLLRDVINLHLAPKPEPKSEPVLKKEPKKVVKKKAKKVAKKK